MPISLVQQGTATEFEFLKLVILGGGGELEASRPATDDDQRDADVHRRSDFRLGLGFQVKSAVKLEDHDGTDRLHIRFKVLKDRLINHPLFFYFFAFLDLRIMRIADPAFIVPSAEVHQHAIPHLYDGAWHFDFKAGLGPKAYGLWVPYRVDTLQVGKRILDIIHEFENDKTIPPIPSIPRLVRRNTFPPPVQGTVTGGDPNLLWVRRHDTAA